MYSNHLQNTRRTVAKAALLEAAQNMERFYMRNNTYVASGGPDPVETQFHTLSFVGVPTVSVFVVQAVPKAGESSDRCGTLTINQAGQKTAKVGGVDVAGCW
jgi:type IV pilus assembly protein PilE